MHEDEVDGEAMEPGGEGALAAEAAELAEEMEEGLLGHVLGFGDVAEHAQAEGVDAALVERVELGRRPRGRRSWRARWLRLRRRLERFRLKKPGFGFVCILGRPWRSIDDLSALGLRSNGAALLDSSL